MPSTALSQLTFPQQQQQQLTFTSSMPPLLLSPAALPQLSPPHPLQHTLSSADAEQAARLACFPAVAGGRTAVVLVESLPAPSLTFSAAFYGGTMYTPTAALTSLSFQHDVTRAAAAVGIALGWGAPFSEYPVPILSAAASADDSSAAVCFRVTGDTVAADAAPAALADSIHCPTVVDQHYPPVTLRSIAVDAAWPTQRIALEADGPLHSLPLPAAAQLAAVLSISSSGISSGDGGRWEGVGRPSDIEGDPNVSVADRRAAFLLRLVRHASAEERTLAVGGVDVGVQQRDGAAVGCGNTHSTHLPDAPLDSGTFLSAALLQPWVSLLRGVASRHITHYNAGSDGSAPSPSLLHPLLSAPLPSPYTVRTAIRTGSSCHGRRLSDDDDDGIAWRGSPRAGALESVEGCSSSSSSPHASLAARLRDGVRDSLLRDAGWRLIR